MLIVNSEIYAIYQTDSCAGFELMPLAPHETSFSAYGLAMRILEGKVKIVRVSYVTQYMSKESWSDLILNEPRYQTEVTGNLEGSRGWIHYDHKFQDETSYYQIHAEPSYNSLGELRVTTHIITKADVK